MLRGQASRSRRFLAAGSSQPPPPSPPSSSRGLASSASSSSPGGDPPPVSRRSISAVAVQRRVEAPVMLAYDDSESSSFVGRLSWPASASAAAAAPTAAGPSGSSGELWDMRRRAFKPREGKERADPKVDTRAATLERLDRLFPSRRPAEGRPSEPQSSSPADADEASASSTVNERPATVSNPGRHLQQLPSVGRKISKKAVAQTKPLGRSSNKNPSVDVRSRAQVAAILLPPPPPLAPAANRRADVRTPRAAPPPPLQDEATSFLPTFDGQGQARPDPTPEQPTAQTSAFAIHFEHAGLHGRPAVLFVSQGVRTLLAERYVPCPDSAVRCDKVVSAKRNLGATVVAQAAGADRLLDLIRALGSGLRPYLPTASSPSSPPPSTAADEALARECAALIWKILEIKPKKHHEEWYWLTRADLELQGTIPTAQLASRALHTRASAKLKHSLPALYALARSIDPDGGLQAAYALFRAASHFEAASTAEGRTRLEAAFGSILGRLVADGEAGAEGFQHLVWMLELRAHSALSQADQESEAEERRSLGRLAVRLLHASPAAALPDLSFDVCARLADNAMLAPSSGAIARLGLLFVDPESMARLLGTGVLRERHAALLLDRTLARLEAAPVKTEADDDRKVAVARSLSAMIASDRLPALVPGPLARRLIRFLAEYDEVSAAAQALLSSSLLGQEMEPASIALARDIVPQLAKERTTADVSLGYRLLEAIPVGQRSLGVFNALLRQANTTFRQRKDADAVTAQIEALLAAEPGLVADVGTIEARLLAPPRSERQPLVEYSMEELIAHSGARAQTYAELWQLTLDQGTTFRPLTWRLLLSAIGREAGYFRAREVVDWMRLHGATPDMAVWNQVLANARRAQGRSGQAMIKVFRTSLRQLVREEETFEPNIDTFLEIARVLVPRASRHFAAAPLRELCDAYARQAKLPFYPEGGLAGLAEPAPKPAPGSVYRALAQDPSLALPELVFRFPADPTECDYERHVLGAYELFRRGFENRDDGAAFKALDRAHKSVVAARRRELAAMEPSERTRRGRRPTATK